MCWILRKNCRDGTRFEVGPQNSLISWVFVVTFDEVVTTNPIIFCWIPVISTDFDQPGRQDVWVFPREAGIQKKCDVDAILSLNET